jgi:DNA polymerase-3 subunit alpha
MNFVHLHAHSTFSFLDGYGTPEQIRDRIIELGQKAVAVTDHGSIFGYVPYNKAFRKSGIKVIYGIEAYIVDDLRERTRNQESFDGVPHITILAKDIEGYRNLLRLNRLSWEEGFYYKPRIDHQALITHQKGLIVLSGCPTGYPTRYIDGGMVEKARSHIEFLRNNIEHYYIELTPAPDYAPSYKAIPYLMRWAIELGIPPVATADAHFPRPEDSIAQDILLCAGTDQKIFSQSRKLKIPSYFYYCDAEEVFQRLLTVGYSTPLADQLYVEKDWYRSAVNNSSIIADMVDVELPRATSVSFPGIPEGKTQDQYLFDLLTEGFIKKVQTGIIPHDQQERYWAQCCEEYNILVSKGFSDYILATVDVITYMKNKGNIVVCRGSAGGSCLLWVLNASTVDPIKNNLSFDRFYDRNRQDPPDVDIDFGSSHRGEVIDYLFNKYGSQKCSQISSISTLGPKGALQDTAKVLGISRDKFSDLSEILDGVKFVDESILESIRSSESGKCLVDMPDLNLFIKIIGQYRHSSKHAAGVLIAKENIDDIVGITLGADKRPVATVDKHGAAELGFLKMDILGVTALDSLSYAAQKIGNGSSDWIEYIPENDPKTLETLNSKRLVSIFQLEGYSAEMVVRQIGISSFDDIVAASALCRPGPKDWIPTYKYHKENPEEFERWILSIHPVAAEIVRSTYGLVVYQEQVMALAEKLAKFNMVDVHKLRKGVSSSAGDAWFAEWSTKFIDGCLQNGVSAQEAKHWWESIQTHSHYSFNRAHCTTYADVAYKQAYIKTYWPSIFYEAELIFQEKETKTRRLIKEFVSIGGKVVPIHHKYSQEKFSSHDGVLYGGLESIKGVGSVSAKKIREKGPYNSWPEFIEALPKGSRSVVEHIYAGGKNNICETLYAFPWSVVTNTDEELESMREQRNAVSPRYYSVVTPDHGQTLICGYVSELSVDYERISFSIEDEVHSIPVRVARKKVGNFQHLKKIPNGSYVCAKGRFYNSSLFVENVEVLKYPCQFTQTSH